jgi:hypothetical protein
LRHTEQDFDRLSWHDCHIRGLELRVGDPDEDDWTSDLVLHLDFIVEWLCGVGEPAQFRVAPAELVFHGVTELHLALPWSEPTYRVALYLPAIDRIEREVVTNQKVFLDRPYYAWRIRLNRPSDGEIRFGAVGFAQSTLGPALLTSRQHLTARERERALFQGAPAATPPPSDESLP